MGVMRDALINYLGTMGRNTAREIMSMDELIRTFSLDSVSASDNVFDREKLLWFNREYLKHMPIGKLIEEAGLGPGEAPRVSAVRENASTINELRDYLGIFAKPELDERALHYLAKTCGASEIARSVRDILSGNKMVSFDEVTKSIGQPGNIRKKDIFMILRAFITGRPDGPPLKDVFPLVPSEIIIGRIEAYLNIRHER